MVRSLAMTIRRIPLPRKCGRVLGRTEASPTSRVSGRLLVSKPSDRVLAAQRRLLMNGAAGTAFSRLKQGGSTHAKTREAKPGKQGANRIPYSRITRASQPDLSRRGFVATASAAAVGGIALAQGSARGAIVRTDFSSLPPYGNGTIPAGIRSRPIANVNGMTVHILEAGYETPGRPAVLLLHGFPELAYSWRKVMLPLAAAGYHVIAPDQRGYGRTTRLGRFLRRRSGSVSHSQHDARRHRARLRARLPLGRDGGRTRRRRAGRVLVRAHPARYLPFGHDHELAV